MISYKSNKRYCCAALFIFLLGAAGCHAQYAANQKKKKSAGDLIESTSYNDDKRGTLRTFQYLPDGGDFVCVNGKNRYTRALYGSHTEWRLETSDRPIFASFVKNNSHNIRFRLRLPFGVVTPLEETSWCEARYTPGRRSYKIKDSKWGDKVVIEISVLASTEKEEALWKISSKNLPSGSVLEVLSSPIRVNKLMRNGDMGADAPGCFDPSDDGTILQTLNCILTSKEASYVAIANNELKIIDGKLLYSQYEKARSEIANRIKIKTPDPYINTIGGALAIAADGIWDGQVWLHGAIGWRMPLSGWRAAYTGDVLGWHDRAKRHFDAYAASQVTNVPNTIPHPAQDSTLSLARSAKIWGTPQYSNGYICRNPQRNDQMHHYDMNLCYIDELLWHFNWTGDLEYAKKMWPVLTLHLAWEKRNFDPDDDGLYDAYACIWASDALYYNSGAVTHSSAYNYRANKMAAMIAEKIGKDPTPYRNEANKILSAINQCLWIKDNGHWAEFQDFMGKKRLHEDAAVWTIYHSLDSEIANPFQAYLASRYVDKDIPHIPVTVSPSAISSNNDAQWKKRVEMACNEVNKENYATISTTDWLPYSWSINNVAFAEVMHTALSFFQSRRGEEGFKLLKSSVLDGMYLGESPANFGQISFYDAARGECYRDFGDPIGVASRVLIQGLYGVLPDALNSRLLLRPAFPKAWEYASLNTPDIDFDFKSNAEGKSEYTLTHHLPAVKSIELQLPANRSKVEYVKLNGKRVAWKLMDNSIGLPQISLLVAAAKDENIKISIEMSGSALCSPSPDDSIPSSRIEEDGGVDFVLMEQDDMKWWAPIEKRDAGNEVSKEESVISSCKSSVVLDNVVTDKCIPVEIDKAFNAKVTDIFNNEYLSPRSPYTTLQLPKQGIGEWCHPLMNVDINDSGLRAASCNGMVKTGVGIPFRTPSKGNNIVFSSLWDNYPDSVEISLNGKATCAYLLMAGSTNHMQCHIENASIRAYYTDGTFDTLPLMNPYNWAPIEQLFFEDGKAFDRKAPSPYRLRLKNGDVSNSFAKDLGYKGVSCMVDGGAAIILKMPLNGSKELSHLTLSTLSNEVVIGIMGITLQR